MENTLDKDDIIFRSDLLKTILSRAGSYIVGIITAYILPYLFQEGFSGMLDNITWDTIKQVSISIIIVLLAEAGLRYIFYEASRMRANSDLRDKAIIFPKGVRLTDVIPFVVTKYTITYKYTHNKSGGLDLTRIESATVLGGNYNMQFFKFDILDSFPKFSETDIQDPSKTEVRFETDKNSDLQKTDAGWRKENNVVHYVTYYNNIIGPKNKNKLIYALDVKASDYIPKANIDKESSEQVSEKVILEVKDITIKVELPEDIIISDLDFQAIGKSNVKLEALASIIKRNNDFEKNAGKQSFSINIDSPVPDVRYGFTWKWKKPLK